MIGTLSMFGEQSVKAENPIIQNVYTADPAPMVSGDTLYLYTSHDEDNLVEDFYTMDDWKCFSTKDMVNWTDHGTMASRFTTFSWSEARAWAPQCVERNGKYYLYVPLQQKGAGMTIGVGVSDSPTGPFVDAIGKPLLQANWDYIDPTVFIDDDGQAYLYFGNPRLYCVKLNEDMISYDESEGKHGVEVFDMDVEEFGPREGSTSSSYGEGPWFYKRGNIYYMVYAAFEAAGSGEHIAYATSTGPMGPWKYGGIIMKNQGGCFTNHSGVVDFKGHSYFFYHNQALPDGGSYHRSVAVEEFKYNEDGSFPEINMTKEGVDPIGTLNPYDKTEAETFAYGNDIEVEDCVNGGRNICDTKDGSYLKVREVEFGERTATKFTANICAKTAGQVELRLDGVDGEKIATVDVEAGTEFKDVVTEVSEVTGKHDLYFVFKGEGMKFDSWQFEQKEEPVATPVASTEPTATPAVSVAPSATPVISTAPTAEPTAEPTVSNDTKKPSRVSSVKVKKKGAGKVAVSWSKAALAKGYEIQYATDKSFKKGVKKVTTTKLKYTIKKLKKGKKYYVKVRAYSTGKIYGKFSSVVKVKA